MKHSLFVVAASNLVLIAAVYAGSPAETGTDPDRIRTATVKLDVASSS